MKAGNNGFGREYSSALKAYLKRRDEATLSAAYELGRRALGQGLGVLDMATVHGKALEGLAVPDPYASVAGGFFQELLSPFEMSLRGYRGANEELQRLNARLSRQKEALELSNRELESFSYSVSHDLRAPLRRIDGFCRGLDEIPQEELDEHAKDYIRRIQQSARDMAQLIDALLVLSQVTRAGFRASRVDLTAIARRVAEQLFATAPERSARFDIQEGLTATGDVRLLTALLENLLGNAWKFTSKRELAVIEFGASAEDGRVVYFVRDNGAGFDMQRASKLFQAFHRLHSTSDFEGTGIGLATVQRIVHRHGGTVWAEGRVGSGATFSFTLNGSAPAP